MGQKVNPHGFRVGVIKDWDSHWYAKKSEMGDLIVEDYNLRKFMILESPALASTAQLMQ